MKKIIVLTIFSTTTMAQSTYLPEAKVRDICLRDYARTITCEASYKGKALSIDFDKEDLKPQITNYGSYGVAVNGFYAKAGRFSSYPRWEIKCDSITGKRSQTFYTEDNLFDLTHGAMSTCR